MKYGYQDALAFGGISGAHPGGFLLTKKIIKNEKIKPGAVVLDAGCGMGQTSLYLAKEFKCDVHAVDIHPKMIEQAEELFNREGFPIKLTKGSIEELSFPNAFFDWVIAESSTIFTEIPKSLREYARVLKPDGKLICVEMVSEEELDEREQERMKEFYGIEHFPTEKEWLEAFQRAGFDKVELIHAKTILHELEEYPVLEENTDPLVEERELEPNVENILHEHGRITMDFAEKLGYRVFKACKTGSDF